MLERTIANTGACPKTFIAVAAGFCVGEAFSKRSSCGLLE
jgi:hypothetical protein